ncbi:N-acetylglucosamine kinase [Agromyces sp. NPDC055520]
MTSAKGAGAGAGAGAGGPGAVLAIDGGGSKTHVAVLAPDGAVLAVETGPGSSTHVIGLTAAAEVLDTLVRAALERAGGASVLHRALYLSGLDLPPEHAALERALERYPWMHGGSGPVLGNDLLALLRAGTDEPDAVAVVCGTGINAVGVAADGRTVRFPSLGMISGDWGGGWHLGEQSLWHAARAVDGRGAPTLLVDLLPAVFGLDSIDDLIAALHFERIPTSDLALLAPALFEAAAAGDAIAVGLVERQAEEIVAMARAALTRLGLLDRPVPVVLGGGVIAAGDGRLIDGVRARLAEVAPLTRIELVSVRPIVGAGLLALEQIGAGRAALDRARRELAAVP